MRYAIIIEPTGTGYSVYALDVPGCVATGATAEEAKREIQEALRFHFEALRQDGQPIPPPSAMVHHVDVV